MENPKHIIFDPFEDIRMNLKVFVGCLFMFIAIFFILFIQSFLHGAVLLSYFPLESKHFLSEGHRYLFRDFYLVKAKMKE